MALPIVLYKDQVAIVPSDTSPNGLKPGAGAKFGIVSDVYMGSLIMTVGSSVAFRQTPLDVQVSGSDGVSYYIVNENQVVYSEIIAP